MPQLSEGAEEFPTITMQTVRYLAVGRRLAVEWSSFSSITSIASLLQDMTIVLA